MAYSFERYDYKTPLIETDLDKRVKDILIDNGIKYYGQLRLISFHDYMKFKGFGQSALTTLKEFIGDDWPYFFNLTLNDIRDYTRQIMRYRHRILRAINDYKQVCKENDPLIDEYELIRKLS